MTGLASDQPSGSDSAKVLPSRRQLTTLTRQSLHFETPEASRRSPQRCSFRGIAKPHPTPEPHTSRHASQAPNPPSRLALTLAFPKDRVAAEGTWSCPPQRRPPFGPSPPPGPSAQTRQLEPGSSLKKNHPKLNVESFAVHPLHGLQGG